MLASRSGVRNLRREDFVGLQIERVTHDQVAGFAPPQLASCHRHYEILFAFVFDLEMHGRLDACLQLLVVGCRDEFHRHFGRKRPEGRFLAQLADELRLAGTCIGGDPNRAVIQHPSATFREFVELPLLLAVLIDVYQRSYDGFAVRQHMACERTKRVRADPFLS